MQSEKTREKKDMYDFIGEGNTIYDFLNRYIPELEGDFNTINLISKLEVIAEKFGNQKNLLLNSYTDLFYRYTDMLSEALKRNRQGKLSKLTSRKEEQILSELQGLPINHYSLNTLEAYIDFARKNEKNPDVKIIKDKLLEKGLEIFGEVLRKENQEIDNRKTVLLVYLGDVSNKLKAKYPNEVERVNAEEWKELNIISRILLNRQEEIRYVDYLNRVRAEEDLIKSEYEKRIEQMQKTARYKIKREEYISKKITKDFSESENNKLKELGISSIEYILGSPEEIKMPKTGSMEWEFSEEKNPQVIFDEYTSYSPNGEENQKVIAVNYGKFKFKVPNAEQYLNLVGVTRVGLDGSNTYFVFMPLKEIELKKTSELSQDSDKIVNYYLKSDKGINPFAPGEKRVQPVNDEGKLEFVKAQAIPNEYKEYYANIFFSDLYMQTIQDYYKGYAGIVTERIIKDAFTKKETKMVLPTLKSLAIGSITDKDAINYATRNLGKRMDSNGRIKMLTTSISLRNSDEFKQKQFSIVKSLCQRKELENTVPQVDSIIPEEGDAR